MNQEAAEEQRPIPQTFCGALQKEANCKCLVLSVLIYGCLAAVTWCRCANVTKVVIDFLKYPITSTKHVSPCDDGYVYIPVAFMGMLYLVYLVECYHSPIRIDLLHARSQDSILTKLAQLKMAQATIWWKAISYHYVRRKRQITRYRNGDNYTTTQVYYERVNTHAATSFYFYGYCGVKDISKELVLDPKLPITKITLGKGFAFSNMRSATEFEEARSRFFAEQEHRDDYMEMREGLDLGYNFNPTSLVAVLGRPWFTNAYVYWSLSALLLSWPLRIIIECNTQYADYQITKLFGINYDAPSANGQPIHASSSQLSAPGSYMLVPSYSEALLMEPAPVPVRTAVPEEPCMEMVPSYSEALLYERAYDIQGEVTVEQCPEGGNTSANCECPCHGAEEVRMAVAGISDAIIRENVEIVDDVSRRSLESNTGTCSNCSEDSNSARLLQAVELTDEANRGDDRLNGGGESARSSTDVSGRSSYMTGEPQIFELQKRTSMLRENSAPNLRTNSELFSGNMLMGKANVQSLENILEHDETDVDFGTGHQSRNSSCRAEALILEDDDSLHEIYDPSQELVCSSKHHSVANVSRGAIPKKYEIPVQGPELVKKIPNSRTYFCIKSILKQHRRRYTLVTPEELQTLVGTEHQNGEDVFPSATGSSTMSRACNPHCCGAHWERVDVNSNTLQENNLPVDLHLRRTGQLCQGSLESLSSSRGQIHDFSKRDLQGGSSRTLIFASPIQEICPSDPFGGRTLVPSENPPNYEEALDLPVLSRLKRSFTERETRNTGGNVRKHHRTFSIEPEYLFSGNRGDAMPYDVVIPVQNSRIILPSQYRRAISEDGCTGRESCVSPAGINTTTVGVSPYCQGPDGDPGTGRLSRLTRSLTERTSSRRNVDRNFRRSLTDRIEFSRNGSRRTNINMETSL